MPKKKSELMLANEHASVALASVVYDPGEDDLLVAAFAVATSVELLVNICKIRKQSDGLARSVGLVRGSSPRLALCAVVVSDHHSTSLTLD